METMLSENMEEKKQSLMEGTLFTASSPQRPKDLRVGNCLDTRPVGKKWRWP